MTHRSASVDDAGSKSRRAPLACLALLCLPLWACRKDPGESKTKGTMGTDLVASKRLIELPAEVSNGEWQTGRLAPHGGDCWLAAVLELGAGKMTDFCPAKRSNRAWRHRPACRLTGRSPC